MNVEFYCRLTAPSVELDKQKEYVANWLSDVKDTTQVTLRAFCISGCDLFPSLVASEPPYQAEHSFDEEYSLTLYFRFQVYGLEGVMMRVELLKLLFLNLAYKKGIVPYFEYHLDLKK